MTSDTVRLLIGALLMAMTAGLACGMGWPLLAAVFTLALCALYLLLMLPFLPPQLVLPPFGEALQLFGGKIASRLDQLPDTLFHLRPVQQLVGVRVDDVPQPDADALGVIIDGEFLFYADRIDASGAIFLFEELCVVGGGLLAQILAVDAVFAVAVVAALAQDVVKVLLGNDKSGGLVRLRFRDGILLFVLGGEEGFSLRVVL